MSASPSAGDGGAPAAAPLASARARWREVARRFALDEVAIAAGDTLLAAELDAGVRHRLLSDMADKVAPRRRDVIAALEPSFDAERAAAAVTALEARGLVTTFRQYAGPWVLAELVLEPRVRQHCLDRPAPADAAAGEPADLRHTSRVERQLASIMKRVAAAPARHLVVLRGRSGSGRESVLTELLRSLGVAALARSVSELRAGLDPLEPELSGRAAVWDARRWDPTADDQDLARRWLRRSPTVAVALLDKQQDAPDVDGRAALYLDLDPTSWDECHELWRRALARSPARRNLIEPAARILGDRSRAGMGLASRAALAATRKAKTAQELAGEIDAILGVLAQPSMLKGIIVERPQVERHQVIASPHTQQMLERLMILCESHARVETFGRVGVKALFTGASGTGKTMAARALAHDLGRPLHRVDLAQVVSRWVGETEKNLRDVLAAGEAMSAVLLFDEGDSLFSKRGEVEKGTDRYANMEVSYLLQAIEAYTGIAIVTTNKRQNIDVAFERRFDMFIEFSSPGRSERAQIWRQELGQAASALPEGHVEVIAKLADLNGGAIAAAARFARVLAYRRNEVAVTPDDLRVAVQGEYLKNGLPVQAAHWSAERAPAILSPPRG